MEQQPEKIDILYVLGSGHSGTTIASFVLGSDPNVLNVGELKFYNEHKDEKNKSIQVMGNVCTCGEHALSCPFWKEIQKKTGDLDIMHYTSLSMRVRSYILASLPFWKVEKTIQNSDDEVLFREILRTAKKEGFNGTTILDSSKSLDRLIFLYKHKNVNIKVLHLTRDARGCADAYNEKHTRGFFIWIFQWMLNNFLMRSFLKKTNITFLSLSYERFCNDTENVRRELKETLGVSIPEDWITAVRKTSFHVRAGNPILKGIGGFSGLHYDEQWKERISPIRRLCSGFITWPFHYMWMKEHARGSADTQEPHADY